MFLSFLKNRIIKNIISISLIIILLFDIIAPQLIINSYSIPSKNIKQEEYFEEYFSFKVGDRHVSIKAELLQFQSIEVPEYRPEFLVGIINVDYDNDPISKTIARGVFLGMRTNEIIKEIENKHNSRISRSKINGKRVYAYTAENKGKIEKIIVYLDDLIVDQRAKGGVAVILPVESSTITNETIIHNAFILKSKCINDNTENLGKIRIDRKNFTLPNSINLLKNERCEIAYYPIEGYEFDHWEIYGGKLVYRNNESYNTLFIQNDYGEIIAYYKKIVVSALSTTSSITSISSKLTTSSSIKTTQQISTKSTYTTSIKTQSTTSTKEITGTEIKTTITISQSTLTYSISKSTIETYKVIKENEFEAKYESYYTYSSINTISKTTYNTTYKIETITTTSTIKQDKNIFDTISNFGKSILEGTKDIIDKTIEVVTDFGSKAAKTISEGIKKALDFINDINPFKGNTITTTTTPIKTSISIKITASSLITSSTSSINTKTSNTIITSTTSINTKTSSTSYDIDKHILNNLNYYNNNVNNIKTTTNTIYYTVKGSFATYTTALYTYTTTKKITSSIKTSSSSISGGGGGSPGRALRDSLLLNEDVYKEFLKKIENKKELPLLYIVYKITPLRVEQYPNYKDMIIYKIHPIIKNYDNEERKCILSIGKRGKENNGFFLINPIVNNGFHVNSLFDKRNIGILLEKGFDFKNEIIFHLKANSENREEKQIFFFNEETMLSLLPSSKTHTLNLYLYVYYNGEYKPVDCEPEYGIEEELSFFGETLYSSMIAISNALSIAMLPFSSGTSPYIPLFFISTGTQDLAEYLALKRSIEDLNINEALNKANELIDYYDKIKSNPNSFDYIKAFVIRTIDIFDPLNIASGIILKDIELTLPKQIYNLLNDITNPNISSKEKAKAIGTLVGILFNTYYSIRIFKKELNKFKERFSNVYKDNYEIIKKSIDDFSYIDTRLASKTIILLDKIASKFGKEVNEEAINIIKTVKLLINNKIKIDEIIDELENAINEIEGIKNIEKIIDIRDEIILNKLKAAKMEIYEGKKYHAQLDVEDFKRIGGEIPEEKAWAYFEGFTLDEQKIKFIKNIGSPDDDGRLKFGGKLIYDKVQTDEIYVKLIRMIENQEDFYKLFKENIGKIDYDGTIIEMISHNEIKINTGGAIKIIKLKETILRWDDKRGTLGIAGKFKTGTGEEMIEICTDGGLNDKGGTYMKILYEEKEGELEGRRIYAIKWDEEEKVLKITYGEEANIRRIFFEGETSFKKIKFLDKNGEIKEYKLIDNGRIEQWFNVDNVRKGDIGEGWGKDLSLFLKLVDEVGETAKGKSSKVIADIDAKKDNMPVPEEVKTYYGGKCKLNDPASLEEIKTAFEDRLNKAKDELINDFKEKENYKGKSEYGYAIVFILYKDYENNEITIDVLIAKVFNNEELTTEIIYKPTWWWD